MSRAARRRLYSVLFVVGMGLLVRETCVKQARTHATIEIDLGARAATAQRVDAELLSGGEALGEFHREALPDRKIGRCAFAVAIPDGGDAELHVHVDGRETVRTLHAIDGGTIRVTTE